MDKDWQEEFDAKFAFFDALRKGYGFRSIWSIYEVTDFYAVPYPMARALKYGEASRPLPPGATWLDLWASADALIVASGDDHHLFIEVFSPDADGDLVLHCGS